jgi:hypothetical protein
MGLFGAAGHSPNQVALATRKVCQNDEILERLASCFPNSWSIAAHSNPPFGNQGDTREKTGVPGGALFDLRPLEPVRRARCRDFKPVAPAAVDKPVGQPYLCRTGSMAIARIWLRFCPLNLGLLNSHSFGGCSRIGACSATRHDELIGRLVDHLMAATPNRIDRNLDRNLA